MMLYSLNNKNNVPMNLLLEKKKLKTLLLPSKKPKKLWMDALLKKPELKVI
jgi:hypothetical protein